MVRAGGHDSALRKSPPGGGKSGGLTLLPLGQLRPRVAPGEVGGSAVVGTAPERERARPGWVWGPRGGGRVLAAPQGCRQSEALHLQALVAPLPSLHAPLRAMCEERERIKWGRVCVRCA